MVQYIFLAAIVDTWHYALNTDHILAYVTGFLLISTFVLIFYNRIYVFREQDANLKGQSQNERLSLVLQTGNLRLWLYDVQNRHYIVLSSKGEYSNEYNPVEFSQFFDRDDFEGIPNPQWRVQEL